MFLLLLSKNNTFALFCRSLQMTFGLATMFWTNFMSFLIFYTVFFFKVNNISKILRKICLVVFIPSIIIGILNLALFPNTKVEKAYFWLRIISTIINIFCYIFCSIKLFLKDIEMKNSPNQLKKDFSISKDPIKQFTTRIKYYSLALSIIILLSSWFEMTYYNEKKNNENNNINNNNNNNSKNNNSAAFIISEMLYSISEPCIGIFFFIIYINVSPGAYTHLKKLFFSFATPYTFCCCCFSIKTRYYYYRNSKTSNSLLTPAMENSYSEEEGQIEFRNSTVTNGYTYDDYINIKNNNIAEKENSKKNIFSMFNKTISKKKIKNDKKDNNKNNNNTNNNNIILNNLNNFNSLTIVHNNKNDDEIINPFFNNVNFNSINNNNNKNNNNDDDGYLESKNYALRQKIKNNAPNVDYSNFDDSDLSHEILRLYSTNTTNNNTKNNSNNNTGNIVI
jgi:hypothetical protein